MKPEIKRALDTWAVEGRLPGGFLQAVLLSDLMDAVFRADSDNLRDLPEICRYVYNDLPASCWGSMTAIRSWQERDAVERRNLTLSLRTRNAGDGA